MTTEQEKWAEIVEEYRSSGKSQRVWSKESGIKRSTLRYWLERTEELSYGTDVEFAEIMVLGGSEVC